MLMVGYCYVTEKHTDITRVMVNVFKRFVIWNKYMAINKLYS